VAQPARRAAPDLPAVVAEDGLEIVAGGQRCRIVRVEPGGVVARVGGASVRVGYGETVHVAGAARRLVAPASARAAVLRAREALRNWRAERASRERKPAYVYLHDATIEALAAAQPESLGDLAGIPGIGPAKLDAYGDELLALVAAAREAAGEDGVDPVRGAG
jgi:superfamily II DNA helicase RecQ